MILQREGKAFRAVCSSRKQGKGCRNPSVKAEKLIRQMTDALQEYGICADQAILQRMLQAATIGTQHIKMTLRFRQPTANDLEMLNRMMQERPQNCQTDGFYSNGKKKHAGNRISGQDMGKINK